MDSSSSASATARTAALGFAAGAASALLLARLAKVGYCVRANSVGIGIGIWVGPEVIGSCVFGSKATITIRRHDSHAPRAATGYSPRPAQQQGQGPLPHHRRPAIVVAPTGDRGGALRPRRLLLRGGGLCGPRAPGVCRGGGARRGGLPRGAHAGAWVCCVLGGSCVCVVDSYTHVYIYTHTKQARSGVGRLRVIDFDQVGHMCRAPIKRFVACVSGPIPFRLSI